MKKINLPTDPSPRTRWMATFAAATLSAYALGFWFVSDESALALSLYAALTPVLLLLGGLALAFARGTPGWIRRIVARLCLAVAVFLPSFLMTGGASPVVRPDLATGKKLYVLRCLECHGPACEGDRAIEKLRGVKFKHLGSQAVQKLTDQSIREKTIRGCGKMDPIRDLKPEEMQEILLFVRTLKASGPDPKGARECKTR